MENEPAKKLTFNVGGKLFETTMSTLKVWPDSMLCAIVRQVSDTSKPIFIDRDYHLFRWILQCFRNPLQTVSAKTVGISESEWQTELDYYGVPVVITIPDEVVEKKDEVEETPPDLCALKKRCLDLQAEKSAEIEQVTTKSHKLFDNQRKKNNLQQGYHLSSIGGKVCANSQLHDGHGRTL